MHSPLAGNRWPTPSLPIPKPTQDRRRLAASGEGRLAGGLTVKDGEAR